jgi:membrane fusion protein
MEDSQRLFRQEAIDAQKAPSLGTVRLATPVSHQVWTLAAIGIAVAIIVWLVVGDYTRREHVTGTLVPQAGLLTVTAGGMGTVTKINVAEGSLVHAGDALLTIADDRGRAQQRRYG